MHLEVANSSALQDQQGFKMHKSFSLLRFKLECWKKKIKKIQEKGSFQDFSVIPPLFTRKP